MMFRKLYWVTESIDGESSRVTGVYTSIPDLIRFGFRVLEAKPCRLTLTKLDAENGVLGCWASPSFDGIENDLERYIETEEFSREHCNALMAELPRLGRASVAG